MLVVKDLIYFVLLHLVIASPQINLHLTDWINENGDDIALEHDCLYVAHSVESAPLSRQIIPYCISQSPSEWNIVKNNRDQIFSFGELEKQNIRSEDLYRWSTPIDIIENYQLYLILSTSNISSSSSLKTRLFYNCTLPRFGPECQYSLNILALSDFSLNKIIDYYYDNELYEPETLTCYMNLQCNRGSRLICLDWSEICDGKIDCIDGIDEKNCWTLLNNKCEDDEYRCDNGECISKTFVNDGFNNFECLDRSDENRISSMSSRFESGVPTFEKEDIICSWRERLINNFLNKSTFTSSCVHQRHSIIKQSMFSDESNGISDRCLLAFKCHYKIGIYDNSFLCSNLCQNEMCIKIVNDTCPDIFYYPTVPIAYGHIYFAYTKEYAINSKNMEQIPPEYICYNQQLCQGFNSNRTFLLFNNTCRRPEHFPISFNTNETDWYFNFVHPLYSQLSHCNRIIDDNLMICNGSTMYQCKNSSKCISKSYVGDGIRDCDYKDDEEQTTIDILCLTDQSNIFFKCSTTNKCIHRNQVEDGKCDCEINEYDFCDDENIELNKKKRKIRFSTICDNFIDLLPIKVNGQDQTDETDCQEWPCNNIYTRCDTFWNCLDGSDEIDCNPSSLIKCSPYHHICISPQTNQLICLPIKKVNDGFIDCLGGIDEPTLCPRTNHLKEKEFYCKNGDSGLCISSKYLCDGIVHCQNGDDEQFCKSTINNFTLNYPNNSDAEKFFYEYFSKGIKLKAEHTFLQKSKSNLMTLSNPLRHHCHRGIPLRVWLDTTNRNLTTTTCLCPSSYYGDQCQYQNERVSLTIKVNTTYYSQDIPFVLVITLIDDSFQRIIHSYQRITYFPIRDQQTKFNFYLLYSTRPKDSTKQYSIHIDIYEKITLIHRGSLFIPLKFTFLPVQRIAVKFSIPPLQNSFETCNNRQCIHGQCIQYLNDPKHITFCRCDTGWTGRYCTIPHNCMCSSDSLCVGIAANNRSICVCPINKFGSRCLLTNNVCQSVRCQNGGLCISSDEHSLSNYPSYVCICRKGFSGEICEIPDAKIILSFDTNIILPSRSFIFFHFIHLIDNTLRIQDNTQKILCDNDTSITVEWSQPFHIAFVELWWSHYYLIINQNIYNQSSIIVKTINLSDRCQSISEIFNETFVQMHLIQRIKYYHIPCRNIVNLSCFYDEIHMCLCQNNHGQRLANCVEFNHYNKLNHLDFDNKNIERECSPNYSFNSSTSSFSPSSSTYSGMSSIHHCKLFLYSLIFLFSLYIHYVQ